MRLRLILTALFVFSTAVISAAEEITFTTYYPSPYGSYIDLQSNHLRIGSNNTSTLRDGVVNIKPQSPAPTGQNGDIYFDTTNGPMYYNSGWKSFGSEANYSMVCINGLPGFAYDRCCRVNVKNGETVCKEPLATWASTTTWLTRSTPFAATTAGSYSITMTDGIPYVQFPILCRINAVTGGSECKTAANWNLTSWVYYHGPF